MLSLAFPLLPCWCRAVLMGQQEGWLGWDEAAGSGA